MDFSFKEFKGAPRTANDIDAIEKLEVLIEKGRAAVSCDSNSTKIVCRTVEHEFY